MLGPARLAECLAASAGLMHPTMRSSATATTVFTRRHAVSSFSAIVIEATLASQEFQAIFSTYFLLFKLSVVLVF